MGHESKTQKAGKAEREKKALKRKKSQPTHSNSPTSPPSATSQQLILHPVSTRLSPQASRPTSTTPSRPPRATARAPPTADTLSTSVLGRGGLTLPLAPLVPFLLSSIRHRRGLGCGTGPQRGRNRRGFGAQSLQDRSARSRTPHGRSSRSTSGPGGPHNTGEPNTGGHRPPVHTLNILGSLGRLRDPLRSSRSTSRTRGSNTARSRDFGLGLHRTRQT